MNKTDIYISFIHVILDIIIIFYSVVTMSLITFSGETSLLNLSLQQRNLIEEQVTQYLNQMGSGKWKVSHKTNNAGYEIYLEKNGEIGKYCIKLFNNDNTAEYSGEKKIPNTSYVNNLISYVVEFITRNIIKSLYYPVFYYE